MPNTTIMQKNYSNCPLKKRPVFIVKEGNYHKQKKTQKIKELKIQKKN